MEQPQKICPSCGELFTCEYELGRECWCAKKFPAIMPMKHLERGCYCEKCLEREMQEHRGQHS